MRHRTRLYANHHLLRPLIEKHGADVIKEAVVAEEKALLTEMLDLLNASGNGTEIE